jgi:CheY-like chemotaxis protein
MTKGGPILVFEDDTDDQELIGEVIASTGYKNEVIFFTNGEAAFNFLMTTLTKPFLILSDINMHIMNGLELRRKIDKIEHLRKKSIPFIFFSTTATPDAVDEAYELTVQGFFVKDHSMAKMKEDIKLILDYWSLCKHPNTTTGWNK